MNELKDYIFVQDSCLSTEICKDIIKRFENDKDNQFDGMTVKADGSVTASVRKQTTEINISIDDNWSIVTNLLLYETYKQLKNYGEQIPWFNTILKSSKLNVEPIRLKRYKDNDFFDWHIDSVGKSTANRLLAVQYYLNTNDTGHTVFPFTEVKPVEGRVLIFPTNFMFPHKGSIVTGEKYIATLFIIN